MVIDPELKAVARPAGCPSRGVVAALACIGLVVAVPTSADVRRDLDTFVPPDLEYVISGEWIEHLNVEDRARWEAVKGGVPSHPIMTMDAMGLVYPPASHLPLDVFHEELSALNGQGQMGIGEALMELFNIELISPEHELDLPPTTELHVELAKNGRVEAVVVPMKLREGRIYFVSNPSSAMSEFAEAIGEVGPFPRMTLSKLTGFVFDESTVEGMRPMGVQITYNIRFGSVRLDTGFQWAGRPRSIPINGGSYFLR